MYDLVLIGIQIFVIYLCADFVGGIFHWAEDTLGDVDTPVWGPVFVRPNAVHHEHPSDMIKIHWLVNNAPIATFSVLVLCAVWLMDGLNWQWLLFGALGGLNQQIHRFAHAPRVRLPSFIIYLQKWRLIQDAHHHWEHHKSPHTTRYCVLTPWLNPVLDKIRFWRLAERLLVPIFGAPRRSDLSKYHWYRE